MPIILDSSSTRRTFLDLQDEVLAYGFSSNAYRDRVKRWLNDGVHRVRRRARIADAEQPETIAVVAGTAVYDLPAAAIRVRSLREPSSATPLDPLTVAELDELSSTAPGKPGSYALLANQIVLRPIPGSSYTLELRYWKNSDQMVADGDPPGLPDDYTDLPVHYALWKAYLSEDDAEMGAVHRGEFDRGLGELLTDLQLRQTDRVRQVRGMYVGNPGPSFQRPGP